MAEFFVQSPHTKQECLQVIDDTLAKGEDVLSKFEWGCGSGDHTAYAIVRSDSESKVRNMVPSLVRGKARFVKVGRLTPKQVEAYHKM